MMTRPAVFVLLLCCVAAPAQVTFAPGTAGTGGVVPSLSCGQAYMGNGGFSLNVSNGLGGSLAWVGASTATGSTFFNGVDIWLDLNPLNNFLLVPVQLSGPAGVAGAGQGTLPYPLTMPVTPALAGFTVYAQAVIDEGGVFSATNAIEVRITMPPRVIVGTSVGGNTDPVYVVEPVTQTLEYQFNGPGSFAIPAPVNNVNDARFGYDGTRAYFSQGLGNTGGGSSGFAVQELDMTVTPPAWSTLYTASGPTFGVGVDDVTGRLYTFTGASVLTRELVAVDCAPGSPTYGGQLASTVGLGSVGWLERWVLSPDGRKAAVLTALTRQLILVDTDPSSPGYMNWNLIGNVPVGTAIIALTNGVDFSPDSLQLMIGIQTGGGSVGEVARYDVLLGMWHDHNSTMLGVQNIGPQSDPPAVVPAAVWEVEYAPDGTYAVVSGWYSTPGVGRIDLSPVDPFFWTYTPITSPVNLTGDSWACAVSPDSEQFATFGSDQLVIFNRDGTYSGSVGLPGAANVYTITWHE